MEFEKEYIFPYAGKKDDGTYVEGRTSETQIISILGELPNDSNYERLINDCRDRGLIGWAMTLEYWKENDVF